MILGTMAEQPSREPDVILPRSNGYVETHVWVKEDIYAVNSYDKIRYFKFNKPDNTVKKAYNIENLLDFLVATLEEGGKRGKVAKTYIDNLVEGCLLDD